VIAERCSVSHVDFIVFFRVIYLPRCPRENSASVESWYVKVYVCFCQHRWALLLLIQYCPGAVTTLLKWNESVVYCSVWQEVGFMGKVTCLIVKCKNYLKKYLHFLSLSYLLTCSKLEIARVYFSKKYDRNISFETYKIISS